MILAEIITIGDEILLGQTVDTNSAYIGVKLDELGFHTLQITTISDDPSEIKRALDLALEKADLIIITGGLGPTRDDLTKNTLCRYFGGNLVRNESVLEDIRTLLKGRKVPLNQLNIAQADVPDNCEIIRNPLGTAPGMIFEKEGKTIISMPGVPYEMKNMLENSLPGILSDRFHAQSAVHRMLMTTGYPESYLASLIKDWEEALPEGIKLAYLPSPGIVKLRLTARNYDTEYIEKLMDQEVQKLMKIIPDVIYSTENKRLEEVIGDILREKKLSIAAAESCTGGSISGRLVSVPGSSAYFKGSVVAYSYELKRDFLGVPQKILNEEGAVSKKVVELMAINLRNKFDADITVAVSGIAGPDGGTDDKPVGTVWIAVADRLHLISKKFEFGNKRSLNIERASMAALGMIWRLIKA